MIIAFDIETIPIPEMIPFLPPPDVKLGNLKDPEKIAEKLEEARAKQIEDMGLNPMTARVFCAGMFNDEKCKGLVAPELTDEFEVELITSIMQVLAQPECRIATWNGKGFDLPFLFKRAALLGIRHHAPPLPAWTRRYDESRHIDLMKVWDNYQAGVYTSLENFCSLSVGAHKLEMDFREFPELMKTQEGRDKIKSYCLQDCQLTWDAYMMMRGNMF